MLAVTGGIFQGLKTVLPLTEFCINRTQEIVCRGPGRTLAERKLLPRLSSKGRCSFCVQQKLEGKAEGIRFKDRSLFKSGSQ